MGKALSETVPSTEQQRYMVWINLSITFGMLVAQIFNMFLPIEDQEDPANLDILKSDQYWRVVWAIPILVKVAALIVVPLQLKYFSLVKLILEHGEDSDIISDDLSSELSKIYILEDKKDMGKLLKALYHQYNLEDQL